MINQRNRNNVLCCASFITIILSMLFFSLFISGLFYIDLSNKYENENCETSTNSTTNNSTTNNSTIINCWIYNDDIIYDENEVDNINMLGITFLVISSVLFAFLVIWLMTVFFASCIITRNRINTIVPDYRTVIEGRDFNQYPIAQPIPNQHIVCPIAHPAHIQPPTIPTN